VWCLLEINPGMCIGKNCHTWHGQQNYMDECFYKYRCEIVWQNLRKAIPNILWICQSSNAEDFPKHLELHHIQSSIWFETGLRFYVKHN
jgi:hypothetical protein